MKQEDVKINQVVKHLNKFYKITGMNFDPEFPNEPLFELTPIEDNRIWRQADQFEQP